jgi:hypothetical protein
MKTLSLFPLQVLVKLRQIVRSLSNHFDRAKSRNIVTMAKHAKNVVRMTDIFELQFLCEKTLQPAEGVSPYRIELPTAEVTEFLEKVAPLLGATLGVLHVISQISGPFVKAAAAGLDLDGLETVRDGLEMVEDSLGMDLQEDVLDPLQDVLDPLQDGFERVEDILETVEELEWMRDMEVVDGTTVGDVLNLSPWSDDGDGDGYDSDEDKDAYNFDDELVTFAEHTILSTDDLAGKAGVLLPKTGQSRATMAPAKKKAQVRKSVDAIRGFITRAGRAKDLDKQEIGGLRKTVMEDGRVLWLSEKARCSGWEKVDMEVLLEEMADEGDEIIRSPVGSPAVAVDAADATIDTSSEWRPLVQTDESSEVEPAWRSPTNRALGAAANQRASSSECCCVLQ